MFFEAKVTKIYCLADDFCKKKKKLQNIQNTGRSINS